MGYYDPTVDSVETAIEMYHRTRKYGEAAPFGGGDIVVTKHKDGTEKAQISLGDKAMWKKNIRNEIYTILFGAVMALVIIFLPKQVMAEEYNRPIEPENPVLLVEEPLLVSSEIMSGTFKNISWNIDSKGCLTITGTGD